MKIKYQLIAILCLLVSAPLVICAVPKCNAQPSTLNVTYDEYNWTTGMKQAMMTTPENGLIFKITITNNSTQPFYCFAIYITVSVTCTSSQSFNFVYTVTAGGGNGELFLPKGQSQVWYVNVFNSTGTASYSLIPIGDYTAKLSWSYSQYSLSENSIPPYPFNFAVEPQQVLQQNIQRQNKGGTTIFIGPITFTVSLVDISIPVISIAIGAIVGTFVYRKTRKSASGKKREAHNH
jgi:hypothetical protein